MTENELNLPENPETPEEPTAAPQAQPEAVSQETGEAAAAPEASDAEAAAPDAEAAADEAAAPDGETVPDEAAEAEAVPGEEADAAAPEAPAPKRSGAKIAVAIIAALAVLGAAIWLVLHFTGSKTERKLTAIDSYTYEDETQAEHYNSQPVANLGDQELTNGQLQIYYWSQYYSFLSQYGDYAPYFGLDTATRLDQQDIPADESTDEAADTETAEGTDASDPSDEPKTWEQSFLRQALEMFRQYSALAQEAEKNGFTIDEEQQASLDAIPDSMAEYAAAGGFDSADDYLSQSFGPGITVDDYVQFAKLYALASGYASELQSGITVTDDDVSAYYDANEETYTSQGVEKTDKYDVSVRHILIQPEYDQDTNEDSTMDAASDEAWAAAEKQAKKLYKQWQKDPTEDNFAALADENSTDAGSNTNGGLYDDVYPGQMVTEFNDWCFDDSRQPGDTDIVKTSYGYHIIYYVGANDTMHWLETARTDCISEQFNKTLDEIFDSYTMEVNYANVHIFDQITRLNAADATEAGDTTGTEDTTETGEATESEDSTDTSGLEEAQSTAE